MFHAIVILCLVILNIILAIPIVRIHIRAPEMIWGSLFAMRKIPSSLKVIGDHSMLGRWEWNLRNNRVWMSWRICEFLGIATGTSRQSPRQVLGRIHTEYRNSVERAMIRALKKGSLDVEFQIGSQDEPRRFARATGVILRDTKGHASRMVGTLIEVSENRPAKAALRATEERLRLITENTWDLIATLDSRFATTYLSPSHELTLGYDIQTLKDMPLLDHIHRDDQGRIQTECLRMITEKKPSTIEYQFKHGEGHFIALESRMIPVLDEAGDVDSILGITRDITRRKRAEHLLRNSDKLSIAGQLAAGIAHEIRNPLTTIKGFLQLLQSQFAGQEKYFRIIMSELKRMESIVGEFLLLAKPQAVHLEKRDPVPLVTDIVTLLDAQAILHNVIITTNFHLDTPPIRCDEHQLKQALINLLKNAIEAMPKGGNIEVEVYRHRGPYISICIKDEGPGIPQDILKKLGEPFLTTKAKGTGLGLMITREIIEAHGGELMIKSELNQGTMIEVRLPADCEPA